MGGTEPQAGRGGEHMRVCVYVYVCTRTQGGLKKRRKSADDRREVGNVYLLIKQMQINSNTSQFGGVFWRFNSELDLHPFIFHFKME